VPDGTTTTIPGRFKECRAVGWYIEEFGRAQVSINLTATPSFETFARSIDAWNPFAFWAEAMRLAWFPWVEATRTMMRTPGLLPSLPNARPEPPGPPPRPYLIRETD
jgi:hypothetical protein